MGPNESDDGELSSPNGQDPFTRNARRWADTAWVRGWHAHALDVLDHAIRIDPDNFKLFRKRGMFHLLCPDSTVRDEEQGFLDLRRACELSDWRDDLVRWVADVLIRIGDKARANELLRELAHRAEEPMGGEGA
jgi:hypothetical protein